MFLDVKPGRGIYWFYNHMFYFISTYKKTIRQEILLQSLLNVIYSRTFYLAGPLRRLLFIYLPIIHFLLLLVAKLLQIIDKTFHLQNISFLVIHDFFFVSTKGFSLSWQI